MARGRGDVVVKRGGLVREGGSRRGRSVKGSMEFGSEGGRGGEGRIPRAYGKGGRERRGEST